MCLFTIYNLLIIDYHYYYYNLVPIKVTYILFWQRYFYHAEKIEKEDEKRQLIAEGNIYIYIYIYID